MLSLSVCNENIPCLLVAMAAACAVNRNSPCMNGDLRGSRNRGWSGSASITERGYTPTATSVVCVRPRIQQDTAALFPDFTSRWQRTTTSQHPSVFTSCRYCPLPNLLLIYLQCECIWSVTVLKYFLSSLFEVLIVRKATKSDWLSIQPQITETSLRLIQTSTRKAFVNYIRNMPGSSCYAIHIISHDNPLSRAGR